MGRRICKGRHGCAELTGQRRWLLALRDSHATNVIAAMVKTRLKHS
ncbi:MULTISPECIES: hypothetical protein [unclassified Mesorhizobium]|nr:MULTISPECIES: hypothetical protein [unclassified Mesorhizobium]